MRYQSPISPGISVYEDELPNRPNYPALDGSVSCDAVVIGGGFTGLSAALRLAELGVDCVLIEAHRMGDGGSGRNGGQLGTGQRAWAEEIEAELGLERAKALFGIAEEAKADLLGFAEKHNTDIEYTPGQMSVVHKKRYLDDYKAHAEIMAERFDYPHISYMDATETAQRVGSEFFYGGTRDMGTGHVNPMKLTVAKAKAAAAAGARLFEKTPATGIESTGGKVVVRTAKGTITAGKCLIATNAYGKDLEPVSAAHIMPIGSFIGATEILPDDTPVIPGGESIDDSRFVVRYFRRDRAGRLLFGGREIYTPGNAGDMEAGIRRQIEEVYPALKGIKLTHAWGGFVGITMPRKPFVREVMPNVISAGGYSGHGVMLSNYTGILWAEAVAGEREKLRQLEDIKIPGFPGGRTFRAPLLFLALSWYALIDRI